MTTFDSDMNLESQLQVAFSMNAELKDQLASLREVNWSLQERLRVIDERHEKELDSQRQFYENMMENLRTSLEKQFEKQLEKQLEKQEASLRDFFEKQLEKMALERDAAKASSRDERGKRYGRSSERNAGRRGKDDDDNRPDSKADYVDPESEREKESSSECSTLDIEKLQKKLKRRYPGAEIEIQRVDYSKSASYLEPGSPDYHYHSLDEYFTLSEGEYFRTGKGGVIEKSYYRVIVRTPEKIEEHVYESATVRSKDRDDYKTTDILTDKARIIPNCMFSEDTLRYILMEKYMYNVPFDQIVAKLRDLGLKISSSVLGEHVHNALEWITDKMTSCWESAVKKSYISMIDETRVLVGCDIKHKDKDEDKDKKKREYKFKYIWGIYAKSIKLAWFIYEHGSRGAKVIQPFLENHIGFYTTDGYAVYKIYDSHPEDANSKRKRSACLVHIRRYFVDALTEDYRLALWFIDEISKMFTVEYECSKAGKTGAARLVERLKPGNTADIMSRIESKLIELQNTGQTECGEKLMKAVKYALSEWPAMKRVLENGDIELSNNLCEQMMRHIKMNLKTAGNIGSEGSAKHNAFMYSVIESCRMVGIKVDSYLNKLMDGLMKAAIGEDLTHLLPCYCTQ